jgi:hypothetical protein
MRHMGYRLRRWLVTGILATFEGSLP